jgi:hypothetical protein
MKRWLKFVAKLIGRIIGWLLIASSAICVTAILCGMLGRLSTYAGGLFFELLKIITFSLVGEESE